MAKNRQFTPVAVTAETTIVTADAAYCLDIYGITVSNRSVTDLDVIIKDATGAGTNVWRWAVKAGSTFGFMRPIKDAEAQTAKANNWTITLSSANTVDVTAHFVQRAAG